jgi:hypothetical protein
MVAAFPEGAAVVDRRGGQGCFQQW